MGVDFRVASLEKEAERIYNFKESLKEKFELRRESHFNIKIPAELKKRLINSKKFSDIKTDLIEYLIKVKPKNSEYQQEKVEKAWRKVEKIFFKEIERLTGHKFEYKKYICYLIFSTCGHYEEGTNRVYVNSIKVKPGCAAATCAEEILHLHYWRIIEKLFKVKMEKFFGSYNMKPWQISETMPEYLLQENPTFFKFRWNLFDRTKGYRWIPSIRKKLDILWRKRKSFDDFLLESHKVIGCMPK